MIDTGEPSLEVDETKNKKRTAMTWMQCLKRAFKIDIDICEVCKGPAKVIACITDPVTINKILNHLQLKQRGQIGMLPASGKVIEWRFVISLDEGRDKPTTVFWRDNEVGWTRSDGG